MIVFVPASVQTWMPNPSQVASCLPSALNVGHRCRSIAWLQL